MRRIEFIAPVEAMRGNLSGNQNLVYAKKNNKAFDAPEGRQYARNYDPRYIGARITASGKKIFSVKTKSATKINAASLLRMALLGGSGALYAAVIKNAAVLAQAEGVYNAFKKDGLTSDSFRMWLTGNLRMMLANKMINFVASASSSAGTFRVSIDNPWVKTSGEPNCPVSDKILVKFWPQLAANPIAFAIGNDKGIAHANDTFLTVIGSGYNTLELSQVEGTGDIVYLKMGDLFVKCTDGIEEQYVVAEDAIVPVGGELSYFTTAVAPE